MIVLQQKNVFERNSKVEKIILFFFTFLPSEDLYLLSEVGRGKKKSLWNSQQTEVMLLVPNFISTNKNAWDLRMFVDLY